MNVPEIDFSQIAEKLPPMEVVAPASFILTGMVLWLLGARLMKIACRVSAMVLSGLAAFVLAQQFASGIYIPVCMVAGAILGFVMSWMLFRLWMGLALASLAAGLVPAAMLVWQGAPDAPAPPQVTLTQPSDVTHAKITLEPPRIALQPPKFADSSPEPTRSRAALQEAYEDHAAAWKLWWQHRDAEERRQLSLASAGGALAGLILGLGAPNFVAAVQSSLSGTLLMLLGAHGLLVVYAPDEAQWLRSHPRATVLIVGLITVAGIFFQWTLSRRKADS